MEWALRSKKGGPLFHFYISAFAVVSSNPCLFSLPTLQSAIESGKLKKDIHKFSSDPFTKKIRALLCDSSLLLLLQPGLQKKL